MKHPEMLAARGNGHRWERATCALEAPGFQPLIPLPYHAMSEHTTSAGGLGWEAVGMARVARLAPRRGMFRVAGVGLQHAPCRGITLNRGRGPGPWRRDANE